MARLEGEEGLKNGSYPYSSSLSVLPVTKTMGDDPLYTLSSPLDLTGADAVLSLFRERPPSTLF